MLKKMTCICLALVMVLSLSGCGAKIDYQEYVKATLDASYKGEVTEYAKITKTKEEDATKLYEENLDNAVSMFSTQFEAAAQRTLTDDQKAQMREIMEKLLNSVDYEVTGEEKVDSATYKVNVKVKPLSSLGTLETKVTEYATDFVTKLQNGEIEGIDLTSPDLTEEELLAAQEQAMDVLLQGMIDIIKEIAENPEYGDEKAETIEVKYDKDNKQWNIPEEELTKIDSSLIGM